MRHLCLWIIIGILVLFADVFSPQADSQQSSTSPAKNSAFNLLDSTKDSVRLKYHNASKKRHVRSNSTIYVGIPVDASYETDFISWSYCESASQNAPTRDVSFSDLTEQERSTFNNALHSSVNIKRYAFQELDILKIEINSSVKDAPGKAKTVSLNWLELEVRWTESKAPKADAQPRTDAGYSRLFNNMCINNDMAPVLRRKRILPEKELNQKFNPEIIGYKDTGSLINLAKSPVASRADAVRVRVRDTGMLAVRKEDLVKQGVSTNRVALDQVRVWHKDKEIATSVDDYNGNGVFDKNDAIIFYGEESDSNYTQDAQYFLTWFELESPPKRIEQQDIQWSDNGASSYNARQILDDDSILVEEKSRKKYGWYFFEMDEQSKSLLLDLPDIADEGEICVKINAFNKTRQKSTGFTTHIVNSTTSINAVEISGASNHLALSGRVNTATTYIFSVSASQDLKSASLCITLDKEPETYIPSKQGLSEKVGNVPHLFFDSIEITYTRKAKMSDAPLLFDQECLKADADSVVLHATEVNRIASAWVINATGCYTRLLIKPPVSQKSILFPVDNWDRMELIYDDALAGPYTVDQDYNSSLHRKDQGYDYVMIAPRFMTSEARKLARRRSKDGFNVLLTDVQDIYDEFNSGYPSCKAIKNFLRYAQSEWTGLSPEFVVFIGDCSWDHRDRSGEGAKDFLPTYTPENNPMDDASDEWYAYLWGASNDMFSDVITGRISVQTVEDLANYLIKVDTYEANSKVGPWRSRNVYITDDDDGSFKRFSITNSNKSLPDNYYPVFIHQEDYPLVTNPYLYHRFEKSKNPKHAAYLNKKYSPLCAMDILKEFDKGSLILQYIGHGGNQIWSEERIFYGTKSPKSSLLELKPTTRFPFVVSWSCLTGYLNFNIEPWTICMSEELIRYPDRGAIGVWGPSGGGTTNKHMGLSKLMLRIMTLDGLNRLGEAMTSTKVEYLQDDYSPDITNQYFLFGDPAVQLSIPQENAPVTVEPFFFIAEKEEQFTLKANTSGFKDGKAIVSMTIDGDNIYSSEEFDFTDGEITHQFSAPVGLVSNPTASIRFYAWNEAENLDAWGAVQIPQKSVRLDLDNPSVTWDDGKAKIQFDIINDSPFSFKNVEYLLNIGDKEVIAEASSIPANSSLTTVWSGDIPESVVCAYASISADQEQGILATQKTKPLIISLNQPDSDPIVPLLNMVSFSSKELVENRKVRMQAPIRNFSKDKELYLSMSLSGPGAATTTKSATLAAGRERRLDFSIVLPEVGDYDYSLSTKSNDSERTYSIPITVQGKPDLALAEGDIEVMPEKPVIGKTVYLKTMVYNVGDGPASDIVIKAYDGDPSLKRELRAYNTHRSVSIDRLEPGDMKEVTITWDPKSYEGLGTHEIHFVVDPQKHIEELSEDNNRSVAPLTLTNLPDLRVDKWTDHGFLAEIEDDIPLWGQPLNLLGRIRNIGESDAEYARYTFIHNGKDITYFYENLPKGVIEETRIEVPLYASKNTLRVVADRYDLIGEMNDSEVIGGNNVSEQRRIDFQLRMPLAPIVNGRRIYRATDEATFSAGSGEYLVYDTRHEEMVMHPDLNEIRFRVVPEFVTNSKDYSLAHPNQKWKWNTKYTCFYSPLQKDTPLQLKLPAPNGIYDVYLHLFSASYAKGVTEQIKIKTSQDPDFIEVKHGEVGNGDYMRKISSAFHIRNDKFSIELRPVIGGFSTVVGDIKFVRVKNDKPVSAGYLSPYFPADGAGGGPTMLSWDAEIPEGTQMQVKARWVMRNKQGKLRFFPWARIAKGEDGKLSLPGKGQFFQYYVNFIRLGSGSETPKLRNIKVSIPCK